MTNSRRISIAERFSRFPAGRDRSDGPFSGQAFREQFLEGPLRHGDELIIDLNGTAGFGSSFLEEAFGGLVRNGISREVVQKLLMFDSLDQSLVEEIKEYIEKAGEQAR